MLTQFLSPTLTLTLMLTITVSLILLITFADNLHNISPQFRRSTSACAHPHFTGGLHNSLYVI